MDADSQKKKRKKNQIVLECFFWLYIYIAGTSNLLLCGGHIVPKAPSYFSLNIGVECLHEIRENSKVLLLNSWVMLRGNAVFRRVTGFIFLNDELQVYKHIIWSTA